jgi:hypothetical protein
VHYYFVRREGNELVKIALLVAGKALTKNCYLIPKTRHLCALLIDSNDLSLIPSVGISPFVFKDYVSIHIRNKNTTLSKEQRYLSWYSQSALY